jgi:biotin transporter BioY
LHPILYGFAGFAVFKIPKFGLEIGFFIFQTFISILGQTCRNFRGRVIAQKKLKLGVLSSYVLLQNRKI